MNKGIVFSLDIFIGISLLLIVLISSFYLFSTPKTYEERSYEQQKFVANDFFNSLAELKVSEAENKSTTIKNLIGNLKDDEKELSVLNFILSNWARYKDENNTVKKQIAENVTREMINSVEILEGVNFSLSVGEDLVFGNYTNISGPITVSSLIENTYSSSEPKYGYMARAYLNEIKAEKKSYLYFGGFVGQGNLTFNLYIPEKADNLISSYLEVSSGSNFSLFVNRNFSGNFSISPTVGNFSANIKSPVNISNFKKGNNTIKFVFNSVNLTEHYLGGGFLRVNYNTTEFFEEKEAGKKKYYFPEIEGIINLYDGFYVPGDLNNLSAYLHYKNNVTDGVVYLNIANSTIFESDETGEVKVSLNNSNISFSILGSGLSYNNLSKTTTPLRLGMKSTSFTEQEIGNADVILITDLSGSMDWRLDSGEEGIERECNDSDLYNNDTKRISLAKCLDKEFVDIILNTTGNRVGLVGFYGDEKPPYKGRVIFHNLSTNKTSLKQEIDDYFTQGGTCICCAENKAYEILDSQSNASRKKYVTVMSDGIPTHSCGSSTQDLCTGTRTTTIGWGALHCAGDSEDCTGNDCDCAIQNANWSSCRVYSKLNATVDSIGFGPVSNCSNANKTLRAIASCGKGDYYSSQNASELQEIYRNIAQSIVSISYTTQKVKVEKNVSIGGNLLYNDSFIEFNYNETEIDFGYGEFSITFEENFSSAGNCSFYKPSETEIIEGEVTSYSGDYWTNLVVLTNSRNITIYNLSKYGEYRELGDPFIISIPREKISNGTNEVQIFLGINETDSIPVSNDSKLIYSLKVPGYVGYGSTFNSLEEAEEDAGNRLEEKIFNLTGKRISILGVNTDTNTIHGIRTISNTTLVKLIYSKK